MLFLISFLFILYVVGQLEAGQITNYQCLIYAGYGLLMLWNTAKTYTKNEKKERRKEEWIGYGIGIF